MGHFSLEINVSNGNIEYAVELIKQKIDNNGRLTFMYRV